MTVTIDRNPTKIPKNPEDRHAMRWGHAETQNLQHVRNYSSGPRTISQFSARSPEMPENSEIGRKRLKRVHDNLYVADRNDGGGQFFVDIQSGNYVDGFLFSVIETNIENMNVKQSDRNTVLNHLATKRIHGISNGEFEGIKCQIMYTNAMLTKGVVVGANKDGAFYGSF